MTKDVAYGAAGQKEMRKTTEMIYECGEEGHAEV